MSEDSKRGRSDEFELLLRRWARLAREQTGPIAFESAEYCFRTRSNPAWVPLLSVRQISRRLNVTVRTGWRRRSLSRDASATATACRRTVITRASFTRCTDTSHPAK